MATGITSAALKNAINEKKDVRVIDVRRKSDFDKSPETIIGAVWQDPEKVEEWSTTLSVDENLVVYCVKGGSVSQSVADALEKSHASVRFLQGGILGWQSE